MEEPALLPPPAGLVHRQAPARDKAELRVPPTKFSDMVLTLPPGQTIELAVMPTTEAGRLLTRRRESLGLRLSDVAGRVGQLSGEKPPSVQYLSEIERGQVKLASSKYLRYLSQILHLSASDVAAVTGVKVEPQDAVDVFAAHSAALAPEQPSGRQAYILDSNVLVVDHDDCRLEVDGRYLILHDKGVDEARVCLGRDEHYLLLIQNRVTLPTAVRVLGRVLFVGQYT